MINTAESIVRCKQFRKRILEISQTVSAIHIGGSFSCMEILDFIYNFLLYDIYKSKKNIDDLFIMSKGHGAIAQYVVLEYLSIMSKKYVDSYCSSNSQLGVHPDIGNPGINASTGSLGHGLGIGAGIAYYKKNITNKMSNVYLILSDGELQEGSTWESIMMAANLELHNLVVFLDHNGFQSFGRTSETHPSFYPLKNKFESFGWSFHNVNGHDIKQLHQAFNNRSSDRPALICCNTIKGKGVDFMENNPIWHYRSPTYDEYNNAISQIDNMS
jgi:transketolase